MGNQFGVSLVRFSLGLSIRAFSKLVVPFVTRTKSCVTVSPLMMFAVSWSGKNRTPRDATIGVGPGCRFVSVYRPFASVVVRFVCRAARRSPYR